VLFIDNYDSFVFNLVDEFQKREARVEVWRNNIPADKALEIAGGLARPRLVVLSPGPGTPASSGCCVELVQKADPDLPIFGVCLGHQAIVEAAGGRVDGAGEIVHGKASRVTHDGGGVFNGLPSPLTVGRYHSLVGVDIPPELRIVATLDQMVMAVEHADRKLFGVQFHPESILTPEGGRLIDNIIVWARGAGGDEQLERR
jgi:anthranilate synthase/aminodeoxychorismate synthase-like glutamine amidotransferase